MLTKRMPRMSSVVKSEGEYEFLMAMEEAKSQEAIQRQRHVNRS